MALVPFRVSGQAASQQLDSQLLQVGPYSLLLHQRPKESGNTAHLLRPQGESRRQQQQQGEEASRDQDPNNRLANVGFVLWQSGFVLADFLLLRLPELQQHRASGFNGWCGVRVLELGCGAGTVGMFLALAGAQVVQTDQAHILPLTQENLHRKFPATAPNSSTQQNSSVGTFGQQAQPAADSTGVEHTSKVKLAAAAPSSDSVSSLQGLLQVLDQPPAAAAAGVQQHQEQQPSLQNHQHLAWDVFAPGPLVVQYSWGEPKEQLQARVADAATARLAQRAAGCLTAAAEVCSVLSDSGLQQVTAAEYDVIVGADLLYDPGCHQLLLESLNSLVAAHTQVFLCYRCRGLGEQQFEELAAAAGWLVQALHSTALHPEFQGGEYRLLCLTRLGS